MLNSAFIKEKAKQFGASLCGIGDIRLFEGTDPQRDPRLICPHATCVIGFAFAVPKGLYYGMEHANQYLNYTYLGVKYMDEELAEMFLLRMAGYIENEGYDACVQRNVSNLKIKGDKTQNPELIDTYELSHAEAVAPGKARAGHHHGLYTGRADLRSWLPQYEGKCAHKKVWPVCASGLYRDRCTAGGGCTVYRTAV